MDRKDSARYFQLNVFPQGRELGERACSRSSESNASAELILQGMSINSARMEKLINFLREKLE